MILRSSPQFRIANAQLIIFRSSLNIRQYFLLCYGYQEGCTLTCFRWRRNSIDCCYFGLSFGKGDGWKGRGVFENFI